MAEWVETWRGVVNAWECDVVEHFTIAYYFDRFADATRNFLDLIGEAETVGASVGVGPSRLHATFQHELRAGAAFHITSAVTGIDAGTLRLGHQVTDSTTGTVMTWVMETLALPASLPQTTRAALTARVVAWPGPPMPEPRPAPTMQGIPTARDRVKPWEVDENGGLSLPAHVHRFSAAALQSLCAIGLTSAYMQENRRGFSTFELDLDLVSAVGVGDMVAVHTTVAHLGNSSLRVVHRMTARDGRVLATLAQSGVHLDMEARRSTKIPDDLRALAAKLLIP